jgi:HSP20 family protein
MLFTIHQPFNLPSRPNFSDLPALFTNAAAITILTGASTITAKKAAVMTYIKIDFGNIFEDELQKAVDEVFHLVRPSFKKYEYMWRPNIDVYESADEVIVLADMAGLSKEELHVEADRDSVTIAGIRKTTGLLQNGRYCQAEIPYGYFERSVSLPAPVDAAGASASYTDGILAVRLTKLPAHKPLRVSVFPAK